MSDEDVVILKSRDCFVVGKKLSTVIENKPYAAFWKIPYAEPPVDKLRFKPPKKYDAWIDDITYDYSKPYNDTCSSGLTEDCLYLSLYMPLIERQTSNHTVIVWIHEYSNLHEPDFLIDEGVLVVTVSYRTSILGFLNTGDEFAQGNMGAKDVLMALKWIKDNIGVFNGDVNKVTIVGSGHAGTIVASCLLSTAAEDLFNRAIIQSGSALSPADYRSYNFEVLEKLYWKLKGNKDFDTDDLYEILSNARLKDLTKLSENLFDSSEVRDRQRLINSFGPTVERHNKNVFMNKPPLAVYKRRMANNNVDVMMGYTNLESIYKLKGFVENKKLLKYLNYNFQYLLPFEGRVDEFGSERYMEIARRIMDFYFANGTIGEHSLRRYAKYASDQVIYPLLRQARLHAGVSCSNVYLYRFSFKGLLNLGWQAVNLNYSGATAGDEICYLFRCKSVNDVYRSAEATNERQFIKKIARLWTNFAKCGNPTPDEENDILGDLQWKNLKSDGKLRGLSLGKKIKMVTVPEQKRVKFWDELKEEFFEERKLHEEL
ncbi:neuroligin-4, Y-linked-like [Pectinophora gossypiella]|uniref:neuroligin-4, Y-linked-like n=1 Tax=Pectinophora gossypiella TaxID=13191 RepID=UPI00214F07A6|nr:neuroligin-4, Y-linked-like [Pectinophora gossypiella]